MHQHLLLIQILNICQSDPVQELPGSKNLEKIKLILKRKFSFIFRNKYEKTKNVYSVSQFGCTGEIGLPTLILKPRYKLLIITVSLIIVFLGSSIRFLNSIVNPFLNSFFNLTVTNSI